MKLLSNSTIFEHARLQFSLILQYSLIKQYSIFIDNDFLKSEGRNTVTKLYTINNKASCDSFYSNIRSKMIVINGIKNGTSNRNSKLTKTLIRMSMVDLVQLKPKINGQVA